ncbi:MAG: alpha-amylase family glycosyl hydrolase [Eubacteriales bacterium]|nr:alpha-amylase family glycosyl hydrolase [Eubacteriales bacterium]
MAVNTSESYRELVMYSVFVRNYSEEGTFEGVRKDLERIKALGVDIIWLLPIHPVGKKARKGTLGSPYAISDYRGINPEFGTLDDFRRLVAAIHERGMKCVIDVVYNHTSPDSWLAVNHPEWFYHKPDGSFGNRIGDWSDVIDLDYGNKELWDYQIETLKMWAEYVDGFRCDVAPLVPLEFWLRAGREVEEVRPGCFWLCESVEPEFITATRAQGMASLSDAELYQAFDAAYEYDVYDSFRGCLTGKNTLERYAGDICRQEYIYPENYVKLRFLENHDRPRAAFLLPDEGRLLAWTAFAYFQKGMTLIYAGQEKGVKHLPSLFDADRVQWDTGRDFSALMSRLHEIKKDPLFARSSYEVRALPGGVLMASHSSGGRRCVGIFPVSGGSALVDAALPDGLYTDLISGDTVEVHAGMVAVDGRAVIINIG